MKGASSSPNRSSSLIYALGRSKLCLRRFDDEKAWLCMVELLYMGFVADTICVV